VDPVSDPQHCKTLVNEHMIRYSSWLSGPVVEMQCSESVTFYLSLFKGTFASLFKDNHKEVTKQLVSRFFLLFNLMI
jgi:hypothetical protein